MTSILVCIYGFSSAFAEETISADRPSVAVSASTLRAQKVQVETGVSIDLVDESHTLTVPTLIRYGITDNIEIRVNTPIHYLTSQNIQDLITNTRVEGKLQFFKSNQLKVGALLGLLVNDDVLNADAHLLVDIAKGHSFSWMNVGVVLPSADSSGAYPSYAVGTGVMLYKDHGVFVETAGTYQNSFGGTIEAGYIWVSPNIQIDVYVQQSILEPKILTFALGGAYKR